jgi:molybdenum cofactor cytidylyltransferase
MVFDDVPLDRAEGLILAHTMTVGATKLIKGRRLKPEDVEVLRSAGIASVTGCLVEPGDLDENQAAARIAHALAGEGILVGPASTGRCNLFAIDGGILAIDRDRLITLNRIHEAVTAATAQPWSVVSPGQRVATVKIIPFAVDAGLIDAWTERAAGDSPPLQVRRLRSRRVGLILTTRKQTDDAALDASASVIRRRVEGLNGTLSTELRCPHHPEALEQALAQALAEGCSAILILGALVTTDRRDMVPAAIVRAGGAVDHFGMPVEPGNMLLLAHLGAIPVLALPSCARSADLNGLDLILRRIMADIPISSHDIMDMAIGGLLS